MKNKIKKKSGSVLVMTLIVLGVVLITALSFALTTLQQRQASIGASRSDLAYQNAESGVEKAMSAILDSNGPIANINGFKCQIDNSGVATLTPNSNSGAYYSIQLKSGNSYVNDCGTKANQITEIKSIGTDSSHQDTRVIDAEMGCRYPYQSDSNTMALYHFEKIDSNNGVLDSSSNGNNSQPLPSNVTLTQGICNALYFDGDPGDYVDVPDSSSLKISGSMTAEAWVRWDGDAANPSWERIVGKGNAQDRNYGLWLNTGSKTWLFQIYNGSGGTCNVQDSGVADSSWHYLAGTFDGSTATLYVDGKSVATASCPNFTPATSSDDLSIGYPVGSGWSGVDAFSGIIDEVRISNTARSSSEIQDSYNKVNVSALPPLP